MPSNKKKDSKKRVDLSIKVNLPDNHKADKLSYDYASGTVKVLDKSGLPIPNLTFERAVHYERPKGKKYQSLIHGNGSHISLGGVKELADLDSFFVIDTNNKVINGIRVSAAFFIRLKIVEVDKKYRVIPIDRRAFVYEFHNVPENSNPEMLAILKVTNDVIRKERSLKPSSIGFVTDSELGEHKNISERTAPIYGRAYLPKSFRLIYASADTGQEAINYFLRFCDKTATTYLEGLEKDGLKTTNLKIVLEEPSARYRCKFFNDVTIKNDFLNELVTNDESQIFVLFE